MDWAIAMYFSTFQDLWKNWVLSIIGSANGDRMDEHNKRLTPQAPEEDLEPQVQAMNGRTATHNPRVAAILAWDRRKCMVCVHRDRSVYGPATRLRTPVNVRGRRTARAIAAFLCAVCLARARRDA